MNRKTANQSVVLVTGASGYVGRQVIEELARERGPLGGIMALDIRPLRAEDLPPGVEFLTADIRSPDLTEIFQAKKPAIVVHLASIVTPGKKLDRAFEYAVDVLGTENVLRSSIQAGVDKVIVTSSGAAYGYHPDNPNPIEETDALRGNPEFAYSDHKRRIEEILARYREENPRLKQLVFRPGTILGETASNQITALFDKRVLMGLMGAASPFVFIWDKDVVACILKGIREDFTGIYNLAGDGTLTMKELARRLGKPYVPLPVWLVRFSLHILRKLNLTRYGPEQVDFLRYRPVLGNQKLKEEFGYLPRKTTREVFDLFMKNRSHGRKTNIQE